MKKVLIAEDHEMMNRSLRNTLTDFGIQISEKDYVFSCDDAYHRINGAIKQGEPYEMVVTDLSFDENFPGQKLSNGPAMIKALKKLQPDLKVLVFSIEDRASIATSLFRELSIDGFVPKARHDIGDLKLAIETIAKNGKYISPHLKKPSSSHNAYAFSTFDMTLIKLISVGMAQKNIPHYLMENKIKPCSLSSVEKRINRIKNMLGIASNEQLIAYCKDIGII